MGPLTRCGTSSKAACKVCEQWLSSELGGQVEEGLRAHSRNSVASAYRPARHSALCALDRRTARKGAQCCESAKVKELESQKSCFSEFCCALGHGRSEKPGAPFCETY
jgi:hypothetical protein